MKDYDIIDAHTHISETMEVEKAQFPSAQFPQLTDEVRWAHDERIIAYMDRNGISKVVNLSILPAWRMAEARLKRLPADLSEEQRRTAEKETRETMADRIRRHNEAICAMGRKYPRVIPFINMQPMLGGLEGMVEEFELRVSQGAKGVKLHPGMNRFYPFEHDFWPIYGRCQELGLPIIADSTLAGQAPPPYPGAEFGEPIHFAEVLQAFPRLTLVLAHVGGAFWDERIELAQRFPNVYFDTALGFTGLKKEGEHDVHRGRGLHEADAGRVIRKIGVERVMFGSDGPSSGPVDLVEQILRLDLSTREKGMILAENAKRILKI